MRVKHLIVLTIASTALAAQNAGADTNSASSKTLDALSQCRKITNDTARLACFDRFAQSFESGIKNEDFKIVDKGDVKNIKKSLFGFALPRVDLFGSKEPFMEIDSTVTAVRPAGNDGIQITIAEGNAVWQTTDPVSFPPKPGTKIRIKKGTLGNYFLAIDGKSYRGMRVR